MEEQEEHEEEQETRYICCGYPPVQIGSRGQEKSFKNVEIV